MVWCIGQIIDLDLSLAWDTNKSWNHLGIWCVKLLYQPLTCASFRPFCRSWPRLTLWVRTSAAVQLWKSQTPKWYFGISYLQKPIKLKIIKVPSQLVPTTKVHVRYCDRGLHYQDCDRAIAAARAALERFDGDSRAQERDSRNISNG